MILDSMAYGLMMGKEYATYEQNTMIDHDLSVLAMIKESIKSYGETESTIDTTDIQ